MKQLLQLSIFAVFTVLMMTAMQHEWYTPRGTFAPSTADIGYAIFGRFVLPFEVISLVLLAAMIGAIFIAKKGADA